MAQSCWGVCVCQNPLFESSNFTSTCKIFVTGCFQFRKESNMAKLLVKTEGLGLPALVLRLGVNRVGRDPECEFCLEHPTISSLHCELALSNDGVYVRDCQSTNGTFINGAPILEAWLDAGQNLRLGDVELFVESIEANIAIPKFERPRQVLPPPVVRPTASSPAGGTPNRQRHFVARPAKS